jgi:hypothetical protein
VDPHGIRIDKLPAIAVDRPETDDQSITGLERHPAQPGVSRPRSGNRACDPVCGAWAMLVAI